MSERGNEFTIPMELVPGGYIVYFADGDEEIISANQYVLDLFECKSFDEFMEHTGGTFTGFVHSSDVGSTEDSIWGQVTTRNGLDHIYYQIRTKTGRIVSVDDYGRLVRQEGERPMFHVFVVEMNRDSVIDWLTGLPGMERFLYVADIEAKAMKERGQRPGLLVFDLMGMKSYNAANGRGAGDNLLRMFASIMRSHFGSELCCRHAGDSFCTLVSLDGLQGRVRRLFKEFSSSNKAGDNLPVMAGVCEIAEGEELSLVLDRAKFACDSDRSTWESHLSWYTYGMRREALMRTHVLEHVDIALHEGWVRPYYQGIVRSSTGRFCCAEALARWHDPKYGELSPMQFIPVLEEAGLLLKLDMHMVRCVIADIVERMREGLPVVPVSVNLSVRDLVGIDIASEVANAADAAGLPHNLLRLEFTESAASRDPELLKWQVDALHNAGFEVWMDDFGSGFSSLNALKEFDFDLIKLDMAFVASGYGEKRDVIVDGVIRAAKRIGVRTLAEGVETQKIASLLTEMGCDLLQGYFYSKPAPLEEITRTMFELPGQTSEPVEEHGYWNTIGSLSLTDLGMGADSENSTGVPMRLLPAGVVEHRNDRWYLLRSTESLRTLLKERGIVVSNNEPTENHATETKPDEALEAAVKRCTNTGRWERIVGTLEYGSGFQFRVMPLCECAAARSYVVASTPTSLGSGLGTYGDVPMGYAVLRMLRDSVGQVYDAEFVYANGLFCEWGNFNAATIVGTRLVGLAPDEGAYWLSVCERAAMGKEEVQDIVYGAYAGHWVSYNAMPSLIDGHCIFAFALADAQQKEKQKLIDAGTHDPLTGLLNRRGIDEEIERRVKEKPEKPFVLVLLDVDDFKTINDLYGHDVGDEALRTLSQELIKAFPPTAIIGRNGGDEALVALFGSDALDVDDRLRCLMDQEFTFEVNGRKYDLSISAGYAWCLEEDDLKSAYTKADEALYSVKLDGKSNFKKWSAGLQEIPQRSLLGFTARELAEGMPLAMLAHRIDGEILFSNEGLARLLGYKSLSDALEGTGRNLKGIVCPNEWESFIETVRAWATGDSSQGVCELQVSVFTCDGGTFTAAYRAQLITTEQKGDIVYAYLVGQKTIDRIVHLQAEN